jgi:large subunit ribosomal protein L4
LSAHNLGNAEVVTVSELNTYKILNADKLVLTEASVTALDQIFKV